MASAQSSSDTPAASFPGVGVELPSEAPLTLEPAVESSPAARAPSTDLGAYGCRGATDFPHISHPFASVHGRTWCDTNLAMAASVNIEQLRWWGWDHRANGIDDRYSRSVNANAKAYCAGSGLYTWKGTTYHRVNLPDGRVAVAVTSRENRFAC